MYNVIMWIMLQIKFC